MSVVLSSVSSLCTSMKTLSQKRNPTTYIHPLLAIVTMELSVTRAEPSQFTTLNIYPLPAVLSKFITSCLAHSKTYVALWWQEIVNKLPVSENMEGFIPNP